MAGVRGPAAVRAAARPTSTAHATAVVAAPCRIEAPRASALARLAAVLALALALAAALGAPARADDDERPVVVVLRDEPRLVVVPGTTVHVAETGRRDLDCFRYGVYWYAWSDGRWYRARSWRGPFALVAVRYVPRAILGVPARHWKRHPQAGPGHARRAGEAAVANRDREARARRGDDDRD